MNDSLKHQVIHSLKWVALGKISSQMVRWVITFWVIRLLLPEDYGIVSLADLFFGFMTLVLGPLIGPAIVQHKNISKQELKQLFGVVILVYLAAFFIQILAADSVGEFYQSENVARILKINAWCFIMLLFAVIPTSLLAKEMQFKYVSIVAAFSNIVAALSTLIMAYFGFGFWSIIYGEIISIVLRSFLTIIKRPVFIVPDFRINKIIPFLRFGGLATLNSILFYIFLTMDVAIAGRVMTTTELGIYAIGLQIGLMPQKKILPLIKQVAFPAFAKIQEYPEKITNYTVKAQKLTFYLTVPIFWGLASVIDLIIPIILGEQWMAAIEPTRILLLVMPLKFSQELFGPALSSQKKLKHIIFNTLTLIAVMLVSILIGVNFGAVGLAYAWLFGFPIAFLIILLRNCKELNIRVSMFLKFLAIPVFSGLLMLGGVFFSKIYFSNIELVNLLFQIFLGASIYTLFVVLFDKPSVQEMLRMFKR